MNYFRNANIKNISLAFVATLLLGSCSRSNLSNNNNNLEGFEVKFLVGSDLAQFCVRAAERFNQTKPKIDSGENFYLTCEAKGSGDVVQDILTLAQQLQTGTTSADAPRRLFLI